MSEAEDEKKLKAVEKSLREPVFIGLDTNARIVRVQLLFTSSISIAYVTMGLEIT